MILVILSTLFITWLFYELYWKRRDYPPGPMPLPFVGNLHTIFMNIPGYDIYYGWMKKYGSVYTFWLGKHPVVMFNSYKVIKEQIVQNGDKYADRFDIGGFVDIMRGGHYGIIESNGDLWRSQRRFALSTLRDFGMGKNLMEEKVMTEVTTILEALEAADGPISISDQFDIGIGSIINNLVFGYRFRGEKEEEFFRVKRDLKKVMNMFSDPVFMITIFFHPLSKAPFFKTRHDSSVAFFHEFFDHFQREIDEHKKNIDYDEEDSEDIVDAYLKEQRKHLHEEDMAGFTDIQLRNVCFDLWIAGLETTSNTMQWTVLYLIHHPHFQERMYEEISREVAGERVTLADRSRLPLCNAVIMETQRVANIVPQNLPRVVSEDVIVEGHLIKKGTGIIPQISVLMVDPEIFEDPYTFNPDRFIDEKGHLKKVDEMMPFSCGKRQCAGEGLARLELFIFLTNTLKHFKILPVDEGSLPSTAKLLVNNIAPSPFQVRVQKRE